MATITFSDVVGGIHVGPGSSFDYPSGIGFVKDSDTHFSIRNTLTGITTHFYGSGITYSSGHPSGGTIDSLVLQNNVGDFATVDGPLGDDSVADFMTTLLAGNARDAIDTLIGTDVTWAGSKFADHAYTTQSFQTLNLGNGANVFDISHPFVTATGGTGNDLFNFLTFPTNANIDGGGGINTVELSANGGTFASIKNINIVKFNPDIATAMSGIFYADQIAANLLSQELKIIFSPQESVAQQVLVFDSAAGSPTVDLSQWTAVHQKANQILSVSLTTPIAHTVLLPDMNVAVSTGDGNDIVTGGSANDSMFLGGGLNTADGGLGTNTVLFNSTLKHFRFSFHHGAHPYLKIVDKQSGQPGGTNELRRFDFYSFIDTELTRKAVMALVNDHGPKLDSPVGPVTWTAGHTGKTAVSFSDADGDGLVNSVIVNGVLAGSLQRYDWIHYNISTHQLVGQPPADFSGILNIEVRASDGLGETTAKFQVTVHNPNAPVISSPTSLSVAENHLKVGTLTATDPNGQSLVWSIAGGSDKALFDMTSQGVLHFKAAPDFEHPADSNADNIYKLIVAVTNGTETVQQTESIMVTDLPETMVVGAAPGFDLHA